MNWTYAIKHKVTASALLFLVIGVVVLNSLSERRHTGAMNAAIDSMYKDRMLAETYLFAYADHLQEISTAVSNEQLSPSEMQSTIHRALTHMGPINKAYAATYLTDEETRHFDQLLGHLEAINQLAGNMDFTGVAREASAAEGNLHILSSIQVDEAKNLMGQIDRAYSSISTGTSFEIAMLIVIGLLLQALVFASKAISAKTFPQQPNLN